MFTKYLSKSFDINEKKFLWMNACMHDYATQTVKT